MTGKDRATGGSEAAPGQRTGGFVKRKRSNAFGGVTSPYKPSVLLTDSIGAGRERLPGYVPDANRR
jgi:uncharacterized FAD-dependent dehydrogenase